MISPVLIFSHTITPRLQYVVDFLSQYFGYDFKLTSSEEKYIASNSPCKINYSYHRLVKEEIYIYSHVLLFETTIREVLTECFQKDGYTAFFKANDDVGFDLFAAIFFLITRYEEYLPFKKDAYGRYAHQNSLAFRENFLHLPLVNIWLEDFRKLLSRKYGGMASPSRQFMFVPTYDIDQAWAYKNKGFVRSAYAIVTLVLSNKWRQIRDRILVLKGKKQDPFDAYQWMHALHEKYNLHPLFFFLVAPKKGKYDKNPNVDNPEFTNLVHSIAANYEVGLHPSWASGDIWSLLLVEKNLLEQISRQKVKYSRQHYIRLHLPETYQHLIALDFQADYSMGYGDRNGFRASVCTPFHWYNLKKEESTPLVVYPFCFMDANAYYEQKYSAEEAYQELDQLRKIIVSVNGTMLTIWHNSFLGTAKEFNGWKEIYSRFLATF